ncbi:hypothetical protein TRAPUB_5341 [Trametes pubescens]|uniref:F-box domain-containing protein n=1 Tax=Trametes pubescens TaxID=154538 RepID=A0A1M2V8R6_TRAPU|nr:hypothetical protein TRAPUB_5341 [Trametes pubescens]
MANCGGGGGCAKHSVNGGGRRPQRAWNRPPAIALPPRRARARDRMIESSRKHGQRPHLASLPPHHDSTLTGNAVTHELIHHLPNELLLEIFAQYSLDNNRRDLTHLRSTFYEPATLGYGSSWAPLMLVCRFWRELILVTPSLWQEIDIYGQTQWLELALLRSNEAPLTLIFHPGRGAARMAVPLVLPHAHRIRRLIIPGLYTPQLIELLWFLRLLRTPMANLHELAMPHPYLNSRTRRGYAVFPLSDQHLPALRVLCLSRTAIPWTPATISRLQRLVLQYCDVKGSPLSDHRFLHVLETCEGLQELQLLNGFISLATEVPLSGGSKHRINLPRLRKLVLDDEPPATAWFLSFVQLPACASLHVTAYLTAATAPTVYELFASLVPRNPTGQHAIQMPLLGTRGRIQYDELGFHIEVSSEEAKLILKLSSHDGPDGLAWNADFARGITEFSHLFAGHPLEELTIGVAHFGAATSPKIWGRLLFAFPELRVLEVHAAIYDSHSAPLLHALTDYSSTADLLAMVGEGPRHPLCPQLCVLRLEDPSFEQGLLGLLLSYLTWHASVPLPPLESLRWHFQGTEGREERAYQDDIELYGEKLKALVKDVVILYDASVL